VELETRDKKSMSQQRGRGTSGSLPHKRMFLPVVCMNAKQDEGLSIHLLDEAAEFVRFLFERAEGAPEQQPDDLAAVVAMLHRVCIQ
jgi:hypothetical protein